ncbi:MAG: hypothetical protein AAFY02_00505 [Pseudomonadota bacterium]
MFTLLMTVCIGSSFCYYTLPPVTYETVAKCQQQAGLIAGMQAGRHAPGKDVSITFRCSDGTLEVARRADWMQVDLVAEAG